MRAERDLLRSASLVSTPGSAEWIVKLFYSFQDRDHLYLVTGRSHVLCFHCASGWTDFISISYLIGTRVYGRGRSPQPPDRTRCL